MSPSELRRKSGLKRKIRTKESVSRKKTKVQHSTEDLPWKVVSRPSEAGLGFDDGILELEEVEDVEVIYEDTEGGRVVRFNVVKNEEVVPDDDAESGSEADAVAERIDSPVEEEPEPTPEPFESETLLPEWHSYSLHPQLLRALHSKDFFSPTPIQKAAIPSALTGRDIVGVAQTGSGKTLAFGLPILHHVLSQPHPKNGTKRPLRALILAPTRELALQVSSHLNACLNIVSTEETQQANDTGAESSKSSKKSKGKAKATGNAAPSTKPPPPASVAAIVGGMSAQKQRRILDRGVDVLVATPGRLWDLIQEDDNLAKEIKQIKFLVLDEADRMIEAGHFQELENILRLTLRTSSDDQIDEGPDGPSMGEEHANEQSNNDLQTFVFSATLSKDLSRNVKRRSRPKSSGKHAKHNEKPPTTLDDLVLRLDFRDPEPEVIDLSPEGGVVSTLKESKIECLSADKDVYLYYFLLRYPGRSLVFLSSIDGIRRAMPLMELLNVKAFPLHSQLEQRQRLKNLDRFKTTPNSVLLATDIAARGLDIPAVDHVIHYQIPRSTDVYVHRNGRTARAMRAGFSMLMCAPDERRVVRALLTNLGRQDSDIPEMPMELNLLDKLKARVQLARKIETSHHKVKKANHDRNWMKETAKAMELELDSDFASDYDEENPSQRIKKGRELKMEILKAELKHMLSQPLVARGVSTKYITSGSRPIVDDLLAGESNETLLGIKNTDAGTDIIPLKKKKKKKQVQVAEVEEYEEWNGIESQ